MVDNFSILLTHCLLLLTFWLLTSREDLDQEAPPEPDKEPEGFFKPGGFTKKKSGWGHRDA